ncbi:MAG: CDP-diacylglycerol--glycerol-3-phosphate 3-phosphatidyltransferase [Candidatus Dependentiae bacterium]|nr:CDP-diacylglycerol--glycerol-3-phosphate 3-phosphatidyltransferase [Candidatus Dependentiae bacterium]
MNSDVRALKYQSLPLLLTLIRLFSPFLIFPPLFLVLPWQTSFGWAVLVCAVVLCIGITDFVDGWLARLYGQETVLGRVLDPIADKVFVMSVLFFLVGAGRIDVLVAIVLVAREFLVAGLREAASQVTGSVLRVSRWGKAKMALQLTLCVFLIVHPGYYGCACSLMYTIEYVLVGAALGLSLVSAALYVRRFLRQAGCSKSEMEG